MAFAQFTDEWVQDKLLFQFMTEGDCSCCGLSMAMTSKLAEIMAQASDADSDDGRAMDASPWPGFVKESVWKDRVVLRKALKQQTAQFASLTKEHSEAISKHYSSMKADEKRAMFQLPLKDLHKVIADFGFEAWYRRCLITVLEQMQHFEKTLLGHDGASPAEQAFDRGLQFVKGAFVLSDEYLSLSPSEHGLLARFAELGSPKLLAKPAKEGMSQSASGDGKQQQSESKSASSLPLTGKPVTVIAAGSPRDTTSFRADRRLLRIVLARAWALRLAAAAGVAASVASAGAGAEAASIGSAGSAASAASETKTTGSAAAYGGAGAAGKAVSAEAKTSASSSGVR